MTDRELDALVAEKVMGRKVVGRALAISTEGVWEVQGPEVGSSDNWMCAAEKAAPVMLDLDKDRHCLCETGSQEDEFSKRDICGHFNGCLAVVPRYSTDIAAAWKVIEKLRLFEEAYEAFELGIVKNPVTGTEKWYAGLGYENKHGKSMFHAHKFVTADTPSHAICLAALRAVGVEVPV